MQSQVGLPLVFHYNSNNPSTTQNHHNNVSLFGGVQKASYFTSNGVPQQQQQHHQYADNSFTSLSSQKSVKVQPPLSSYNSMSMKTSSSAAVAGTHSSSIKGDGNNVNGMMMTTPAEHYQQSMIQGYESFR
jgi:hypothetical protein